MKRCSTTLAIRENTNYINIIFPLIRLENFKKMLITSVEKNMEKYTCPQSNSGIATLEYNLGVYIKMGNVYVLQLISFTDY